MFIASLGVVRLGDFYLRMHAATKAPSLGIFLMVIGLILHFRDFWPVLEGFMIIVFVFLTAPLGSHMISRTAHDMNVMKDPRTVKDELEEDKVEEKS